MTKTAKLTAFLLAGLLVLSILSGCKKKEEELQQSKFILDYATEGVVETNDPDALQKAFNEAQKNANENRMALNYKNDAYSNDGKTFQCYIGNSPKNLDDLFVSIYANRECTDELYLGQLLRPGTAYETIELERELEEGDHTVYVPQTLIRVVDGEQTIVGQAIVTMDFHVGSEY